ncbi:MAG: hypothetical protein OHK0022_21430 [Roseiflexaceae bacterium]
MFRPTPSTIGPTLYKELYLTTGLYVVFLALAVGGLLAWRREVGLRPAGVMAQG